MQRIIEANIARFRALLADENDPTKRAMLHRLLTEEEAALAAAKQAPDEIKKAYYRPSCHRRQCVGAMSSNLPVALSAHPDSVRRHGNTSA